VKTASRVCETCGDKILGDSPKGLCPACVLETGLGPLGDETVAGIDSSAGAAYSAEATAKAGSAKADGPSHPAEVLMDFGDYELLEEIGRGGQGVVYRARQKSLNRTVALKVIGLGQWATQAHLKRFRREAESAANLDHPCIVPIYDVGEREGSCYFSMKFIDGGQLDEVATRTPISIRNAAELIAKLARTVHYAHDHGILHRDIKPGNILVDAKGEPHLTDFGLARLLETKSTVTHTMDVLGTPSYMAPEQASGHNEQLTSATDVYGLGAVFYQLLTGHPPFAGGTTYETVRLVLETEPRQPRLWNPKIDRELSTICLKCLEKDPKRRYSSALTLAEDLEHWLKHEPIRAKRTGFFIHARKWVRRNPKLIATGAACLLFGAATMWFFRGELAQMLPAPLEKSIAVLPFENLSDDKEYAFFADGVQDDILTKLAKVADLKVISRTSVMQYRGKQDMRQIGQALGVSHVLEGTVRRSGDKVHINAQLVDTRTDTHIWAEEYHRDLNDVFTIEAELTQSLVNRLKATLSASEKLAMRERPTKDLTAYDLYIRAKTLITSQHLDTPEYESFSEAVRLLNQAIERDSAFALAYYELARAHDQLYFGGADHTPAGLAMADAAIQSLTRLRPDSGEAHIALARHLYWGSRDYDRAREELKLAQKSLPNDSMAFHILACIDRRQGRWVGSNKNFERAIELDPQNPSNILQLAENYQSLRRYADADRVLDRAIAVAPKDSAMRAKRDFIELQWHADPHPLISTIGTIIAEDSREVENITRSWLFGSLCQRDFDGARRALAALPIAGCQDNNVPYPKAWCEGVVAQMGGDSAAARAAFTNARAETAKLLAEQPNYPEGLSVLGMAGAALGHKEDAIRVGRRAVELLPVTKDAIIGAQLVANLALIYALTGEKDLALQQLAIAARIPGDLSYGELRLHPYWDPLRGDPRFDKIVASLAPQETPNTAPEKSIAVLPFENLSSDPNNAYFADGIQEEIVTRLASIADLRVTSRTSTQQYQSKPRNLSEIARQLGVANVLEGSAQKVADQVRVNVQLINAQTDSHIWANTYDRKLTDVFSVESEIAKAIGEHLQAKLTGQEEQVITAKPTDNVEAYNAYLRGLAYSLMAGDTPANALRTQKYLREAVRLDPKFAVAWALLSYVDSVGYVSATLQPTVALREEARQAAETALTLQPNLGEALLAKGHYYYACLRDYDTAVRYLEQARQFLPNSSRIPQSLAYVMRRRGDYDRSESYFNEAERLDPRNADALNQHAQSYIHLRHFPEALRKLDQVLNIIPDDVDILAEKAGIAQAQGDLLRAAALLAPLRPTADLNRALETQVYQGILERHPAPIILRLKEILTKPDPALGYFNGELRFWLGWAQEVAGDHATAHETWRQARSELESLLKEQPENLHLIGDLALTNAGLGDKGAALALAEQAIAAKSIEKEAPGAAISIEILARVAAQTGEPDRAIASLQKLLSIPGCGALAEIIPITPAILRLDPMFDRLRVDPRFQELCKDKQP
jgi:TolB-like protein/Flp pilus assembly protein TadD